ncbi:site-2 protease family protein [Actinopolymorpha sp. B9G3]|uniref:site-2 protease family protein n=1 Tax=Actinopolymorpha sp. B9G3 TaxID=3158970 RepID=UPI0032D8CF1F
MLTSSVRLFRVKGVPVGISWTWLVIFVLVLWSLAAVLFPATYPDLSGSTHLAMAAVATVLFFASILAHELSHTLQSMREGVRVREITLWLFGGVSRAEEPLPGPGAEFRVVIAGPIATAVLALVFAGLALLADVTGLPSSVTGVLDYLALINTLLLVFNLVPALPLDGGRLLHALLWWRQGDSASATISAAVGGRIFAVLLILLGLTSLLAGGGVGGIWFLLLGWFLLLAVQQEVVSARLEHAFTGLRVRDLMAHAPVTVDPGRTIAEFSKDIGRWPAHASYPVVRHGDLVGLLSLSRAAAVPKQERRTVHVSDVMFAGQDVPTVRADDLVVDAARALQRDPGRALVVDGGTGHELVGLLSVSDLNRALEVAPLREPRQDAGHDRP